MSGLLKEDGLTPTRLCAALLVLFGWLAPLHAAQRIEGYGPWRFGMKPAEVQAVEAHGPYTPVHSTGGLETKNGPFAGETRNVSFVFTPAGLSHIQVWAYQGNDFEQAAKELHGVYRYLVETFGPVHNDGEPWPADLELEAFKSRIPQDYRQGAAAPGTFIEALQSQGSTQLQMLKLHLHPQQPIEGAEVYGSLIYAPKLPGYWVFLYYKLPKEQGR